MEDLNLRNPSHLMTLLTVCMLEYLRNSGTEYHEVFKPRVKSSADSKSGVRIDVSDQTRKPLSFQNITY